MTELSLSLINRFGGTQPRARLDDAIIEEYAEAMIAGDVFPPVTTFHDGAVYWLADGFHRVNAALRAGRETIEATVHQGTQRDAILWSISANATHGLRRTNEDKRRAVTRLLSDPEWAGWSNREIARRAAVDDKFVGTVRQALSADNPQIDERRVTRNGTEYVMQTAGIGQAVQTEHVGAQPATQRDDAPYYDARQSISAGPAGFAGAGPQLITRFLDPSEMTAVEEPAPEPAPAGFAGAGETGWYAEPVEAPVEFRSPTRIGSIEIHHEDARALSNVVLPGSVDLIVTSPPYNTGGVIEYDGHDDDLGELDYLILLGHVWKECYRVMRPGARICVNVPFGMGRQPWRPVANSVMTGLTMAGFELDGQIVWDKNTTGNRTTWGSWRRPTAPALRDTCEAVIVAHKPGEVTLPAGVLVANGDGADVSPWLDAETFMALTQDHWQIAPESATRVGHPAPFPVKLAEGLIRLYGWPGCTILDPFAGSGTVAVAALVLPGGAGCPVVLVDQSAQYCLRAADRVGKVQGRLAL